MFAAKRIDIIPPCMKKTVEAYVPKDLHQFIHFGEDEIKIESQVIQMMLHRSQEEFIQMLFHFRVIPGGFGYFCSDLAEQALVCPNAYKSLRRNEYVFNHSIVEVLHTAIPTRLFPLSETHFVQCMIGFYQHTKQKQMKDSLHLVPSHHEKIEKIRMELHDLLIPEATENVKKEEAFELLSMILPVNDMDPENTSVWKALNDYEKTTNLKWKPYHEMIYLIETAIKKFDEFILNYPKPDKKTPLVRLFEDRKNKFVLAHELLESMEKAEMNVTGIKERIEKMQKLQTIAFDDLGLTGDHLKQIEFVLTSIKRTEFRAMYIPSFNGNYCVSTSDFLREVMKETITVKSIFQCVDEKNSHVVLELFEELEEMVSEASSKCHFIDVLIAEEVQSKFFKTVDDLFGDSRKNVKSVRKVGPKGFTLEDVQNELRYLGLHQSFARILGWCKGSYENLIKKRPAHKLNTCDMYEILEKLLLACTVDSIPNIFKFFHIHKVCDYIFSYCPYCTGTLPLIENVVAASEFEEKQEEIIEEEPTPSSSSEDNSATSSSSESNTEDVEKKSKRKEKKVGQAEKKKAEAEEKNLSEPESKVCEKCYRTSQKCMETNEKFRQEKIKNKALKKELRTVSVELEASKQREMEKDDEIRILKEKLVVSEEVVAEFQNREELEFAQIETTSEVVPAPEDSESIPEMMEVFIKLLDMKDAMPDHKKEATALAEELTSKTTQKKYHNLVESEMIKFRSDYSTYYQMVEEHIDWIRKNPNESMDLLRLLPRYPELSKDFHKAYDNVVNKKELDDQECLICMESMEEETGTVKCDSCRRRYHMSCAWDWSIVKNECAVCKKEIEFPLE